MPSENSQKSWRLRRIAFRKRKVSYMEHGMPSERVSEELRAVKNNSLRDSRSDIVSKPLEFVPMNPRDMEIVFVQHRIAIY